jgi:cysteine desulfurase / selenocysteine lyase
VSTNILAHVQAWHDAIEPGLIERGFYQRPHGQIPDGRSGSLSVRPPRRRRPGPGYRSLAEHGISCASPDGWLRLSPSWPNSRDEVRVVLAAVDQVLERGSQVLRTDWA